MLHVPYAATKQYPNSRNVVWYLPLRNIYLCVDGNRFGQKRIDGEKRQIGFSFVPVGQARSGRLELWTKQLFFFSGQSICDQRPWCVLFEGFCLGFLICTTAIEAASVSIRLAALYWMCRSSALCSLDLLFIVEEFFSLTNEDFHSRVSRCHQHSLLLSYRRNSASRIT